MWYIIENESDYKRALNRFEEIKYASAGSKEHKEKLLLVKLISDYEKSTYNFEDIDPIEIIKIRMDEFGYKPKDLDVSHKTTLSKILNYKKPLSLNMIRALSKKLHIPIELLVKEYEIKPN